MTSVLVVDDAPAVAAPVDVVRPTSAITVCMWFRQDALAVARLAVRTYSTAWGSPFTSVGLYIDGSGQLAGAVNLSATERGPTAGSMVARAGAWHHAALTFDGTTIKLYLDGVEVGTASHSGTIDYGADPTLTRWCVGGNVVASAEYLSGEWADFRVYSSALAAAKVAEIHRRGRGTYEG